MKCSAWSLPARCCDKEEITLNSFGELLSKIDHGECLGGSFVRRAVDNGKTIAFDELVVHTFGSEYSTTDPQENEAFFNRVDYNGCGTRSGYSEQEHRNRYETVGNWRSINK